MAAQNTVIFSTQASANLGSAHPTAVSNYLPKPVGKSQKHLKKYD